MDIVVAVLLVVVNGDDEVSVTFSDFSVSSTFEIWLGVDVLLEVSDFCW